VSLIMPHIRYGGIVYVNVVAASQGRLNMAFKACLRYIHSLMRLDHVSPTWRQVLWALCWLIMIGFGFCSYFTECCISGIRAFCLHYFILLCPRLRGIW
jgi:hypothetical protein